MTRIIAFIKLGRFLFLLGGFVMYNLGAAVARYQGYTLDWEVYFWGQAVVTSTQLMVHYSNDYFDYAADILNTQYTPWSGGSRILPRGELPVSVALAAAVTFGLISLLISLLLAPTGTLTFPLLLTSLVLSWGYSSPPLRLHQHGLGELAASLIVAVFTPLTGFYVQTGSLNNLLFLAVLPLVLLEFNMLLSVHLPDADSDAIVGKKTLVVRFGKTKISRLYMTLLVTTYLILPLLVIAGLPVEVALAAALPSPLAIYLIGLVAKKPDTADYSRLAFFSIGLLMATAVFEALVLVIL